MAKHKRVSFSEQNLALDEIDQYYRDVEASTHLYFSLSNPTANEVFAGRTEAEIEYELEIISEENASSSNPIVSDLKDAFKYRHWLAHGRYWEPKLGRKYDYFSVFTLAQTVFNSFPFEGANA